MKLLALGACLSMAPLGALAATLPPAIEAFAAEQSGQCVRNGGTPRLGPAFATPVDLNADGALDYVVDLAGLECMNAWSTFCGPSGCPVQVWIGNGSAHEPAWSGLARGWTVDGTETGIGLLVQQSVEDCSTPLDPDGACVQRLSFDAPPSGRAEQGGPDAANATGAAPPPEAALLAPDPERWTVREVEGSGAIAIGAGPGAIYSLAVFCLGGEPWLAARLREPLAESTAEIVFAFGERRVASAASREESIDGALVVQLADQPLAGLLAGSDVSAEVSLQGREQGTLSLRGSSRAIRESLRACMPL